VSEAASLGVNQRELFRHIGRHLGLARDYVHLSTKEQSDCLDILNRALRQFYHPDILPGESVSHRWSFLRPYGSITTVNAQGDYDLPEDFGGLFGGVTYTDNALGTFPVAKVPEMRIRELRNATSSSTGWPQYYCITPLSSGQSQQRWGLRIWPYASGEYELEFRYHSNPLQLSDDAPYPLGGQPHAETLVASAIAAADAVLNDDPVGINYQNFITKLRASISHDRQETESRNLGYFGDGPQTPNLPRRVQTITFEGVIYDGS
jgi:hypothetical protein